MTNITTPPDKVHFLARVNELTVPDALMAYIERGKSVIPVRLNKRPLIRWLEFQQRVATREEALGWTDAFPAMATGRVPGAKTERMNYTPVLPQMEQRGINVYEYQEKREKGDS